MTRHLRQSLESAKECILELRLPNFSHAMQSFTEASNNAMEPFISLHAKPPEGIDLDDLVHTARSSGIAGLNMRELRFLAWALWQKVEEICIAEDSALLSEYLRTIVKLKRRSHFRSLAGSYLWNFRLDGPGFPDVASALQDLLSIATSKWKERDRLWGIFSGPSAVGRISQQFMSVENNEQGFVEVAQKVGLERQLAYGGMASEAFRSALRKYVNQPTEEDLHRLIAWHRFAAQVTGFCNSDYAEALLLPWIDRDPSDAIRLDTRQALQFAMGDPRIHKENWLSVSVEARNVLFRWLIEVSLEQFFSVITYAAQHGAGEHMWERRKNFWYAFCKRKAVQEAWIAFGRAGAAYLHSSGDDVNYAEIDGAQPNHAVLLMRIGTLVIADWNLNGKCHIWHRGNESVPNFYDNHYSAYRLGKGNFQSDKQFVHHANGYWRHEIADYIRRWTDVDVSSEEYAPSEYE